MNAISLKYLMSGVPIILSRHISDVYFSAVKRIIAYKIKAFVHIMYMCVLCIYTFILKILTCIYLYSYELYHILIYKLNIFFLNIYMHVCVFNEVSKRKLGRSEPI